VSATRSFIVILSQGDRHDTSGTIRVHDARIRRFMAAPGSNAVHETNTYPRADRIVTGRSLAR